MSKRKLLGIHRELSKARPTQADKESDRKLRDSKRDAVWGLFINFIKGKS